MSVRRFAAVLSLTLLGILVLSQNAWGSDRPSSSPVVMTLSMRGALDVAADAVGIYVLKSDPYPGDSSGVGWQLDFLSTKTWQVLRSASGDAAPQGLALGFHSVWVLTGYGAKPGGLGSGVNRLDASTLENQSRIPITTNATVNIVGSKNSVWLLGPTELDRIDPTTNSIATAKTFPHLFAQGLMAVSDDVSFGSLTYPKFETVGPVLVSVTTYRDTDLRLMARQVVARFPSGAGDPPHMDLAARSGRKFYVGLSSTRLGESLLVDDFGHILGPNKAAGGTVTASSTGVVWAAKGIPPVATNKSVIQRIGDGGSVERTVATIPGPVESMAAFGSLLAVITPTQLEVLR